MNDPVDPNTQADPNAGQPAPPAPQAGGAQPTAGQPAAGQPAAGQKKGNLGGIMDDNVDVSNLVANAGQNQQDSQALLQIPVPAHPNTQFDEKKFLNLLAGSISLTINEKKKIIQAIPQLSQFQIDELMKIFEEEKGKFAELEKKHANQIAELEKQHAAGSVEDLQAKQEEEAQNKAEEEEAERIKRELGL